MNLVPFPNVTGVFYQPKDQKKRLFTRNFAPGQQVYGEQIVPDGKLEYRGWDPFRSKLCAAIKNGLLSFPLHEGSVVLYLGAANGTTVSHISDIVGASGLIYAIEFSDRTFLDLMNVAENRKNIVPLLEDARNPTHYQFLVGGVDLLYCDVAQPDQIDIVVKNTRFFLRPHGKLLMALKLSSIAYRTNYQDVLDAEREKLSKYFKIEREIPLEPFHKKHVFFLAQSQN